ncbi:iron ABC transporter permease [Paenibacillus sp. Marseille-P2973]|uniref:FecCD family ABC transporter permease n=1 Tax=Paenibacillus sp. Marseille-P2973 TaxID=1871032 RepID=UPI001B3765B7|nr:iron ABC transporter permease [Paenibacillus sp. Marseille-P2973]MBQ4899294.1 iron ABC transporter permease [Paenibacillus sp. Marseille-P2973]
MRHKKILPAFILAMAPAVALLLIMVSIRYGAKNMTFDTVWNAVFSFDQNSLDHQIVMTSRLPRAVGAMLIGAFLAISGALMQGITRNYLASPSIMGVSDGSVFAVTLFMVLMPNAHPDLYILSSLLGSAAGAAIVFGLAWAIPQGMSPVRLAILGTVIGSFLSGTASAVAAYFQLSQKVSFWYNARLHQLDPELIKLSIPFAIAGLLLSLTLTKSVSALSLGEETAAGLGMRIWLVKGLAMLAVVILTGVSVALAGKVAFVGLIIPHIARFVSGSDYRWVIPVSGVLGGLFLTASDIIARFLNYPFETPVGVVTALFGVPFFLYLIRTKGGEQRA